VLETVDVALLDGTFFSSSELPGRDLTEIPHPLVQAMAALLAGTPAHIRFIHLNHSNPLFDDGEERRWLEGQRMTIGVAGERFALAEATVALEARDADSARRSR
jgi:pyrroloquinoline quinone biosynthesis protein B